MELLLLPALWLHMDSGSITTERWPGGKQHLPFPAFLLCSVLPPQTGQEIIYSLCVGVGVLELKNQNMFVWLKPRSVLGSAVQSPKIPHAE